VELGGVDARAERLGRARRYVWRVFGAGNLHDARLLCEVGSVDCEAEGIGTCYEEEALISSFARRATNMAQTGVAAAIL